VIFVIIYVVVAFNKYMDDDSTNVRESFNYTCKELKLNNINYFPYSRKRECSYHSARY